MKLNPEVKRRWQSFLMKRVIYDFFILLTGSLLMTFPAMAGSHSGLWVGTATLKYVSEMNKQYADLTFDLGLTAVRAYDTLIPSGDNWEFNYTGLEADWEDPAAAPFGYSSSGTQTTLNQQDTVLFRKTFNLTNPSQYSSQQVRVWRDDGVVLMLNGEEIFRNNLPAAGVGFETYALSEITDSPLVEFTLPATLLQSGQNILTAEVHCADPGDDDLFFDLELNAVLAEPVTEDLIPREADSWKYADSDWGPGAASETDPMNENWPGAAYDDQSWSSGQGPFGYGDSEVDKKAVSTSAPTVYFRNAFTLSDLDPTHLRVLLLRDDGAVLYVNGTEILRSNLPTGTIVHTTSPVKALGSVDEGRYIAVDIPLTGIQGLQLNSGADANVIAAEVHQHPAERVGGGTSLTRTSAPLDLRLLFHVDVNGTVRLLKEVIQMFDSVNGCYVLLTDHTLVPTYTGVAYRDGESVGRRISAIGFDFPGQYLECPGQILPGGTVTCEFTLAPDQPTNPFLHQYHPDHDNLDARYENTMVEAYPVERELLLNFSTRYPPDEDEPVRAVKPLGWGLSLLGGTYTETLTGLHKDDIIVSGPFMLRQVATTDQLTPQPQ
jgi:hypothetical protein